MENPMSSASTFASQNKSILNPAAESQWTPGQWMLKFLELLFKYFENVFSKLASQGPSLDPQTILDGYNTVIIMQYYYSYSF